MTECVEEVDVERGLELRVEDREPVCALSLELGRESFGIDLVEEGDGGWGRWR